MSSAPLSKQNNPIQSNTNPGNASRKRKRARSFRFSLSSRERLIFNVMKASMQTSRVVCCVQNGTDKPNNGASNEEYKFLSHRVTTFRSENVAFYDRKEIERERERESYTVPPLLFSSLSLSLAFASARHGVSPDGNLERKSRKKFETDTIETDTLSNENLKNIL